MHTFVLVSVFATFLAVFTHQGSSPQGQSDGLDLVLSKKTQQDCGLAKLTVKERASMAAVLVDVSKPSKKYQRAAEALEGMGYVAMECACVTARGTDYFVVTDRFGGRHATKDIPIAFPTVTFENGLHWCKPAVLGGIDSILVKGREQRFLLADWKEL